MTNQTQGLEVGNSIPDVVGEELLKTTLAWIDILSNQVGPRPAGSDAEKGAMQRIAESLTPIGYTATWQPFSYPSVPRYFPYLAIAGVVFLVGAFLPGQFQVILIGCPFLVAALPDVNYFLAGLIKRKSNSQNLIITPAGKQTDELDYLLVSHVDSAHTIPVVPTILKPFFSNLMVILETFAWLAALIGMLWITLPVLSNTIQPVTRIFLATIGFLFIVIDLWQQLAGGHTVTKGANDNASGTAMSIALAMMIKPSKAGEPCVGYLFSGAEEAGLYGAREFVKAYPGLRAKVINLDMVGSGKRIGLVSRAGRFKPIATNLSLNQKMERFHPEIMRVDYRYRAGDFVPFLQAGIPAVSLEATDDGGVPSTYHQSSDQFNQIQPKIIRSIAELVYLVIHQD